MKQKLLTLLICALMMPIGIWANLLNFTVDGISYYVNGAGTRKVMVLGATTSQPAIDPSTTGLLTIPATVVSPDGVEYSVQYIGQNAFKGCTGLTSVKLPNTIINIGKTINNPAHIKYGYTSLLKLFISPHSFSLHEYLLDQNQLIQYRLLLDIQ